MKIITDTDSLKLNQSIITLGKFDGFHIGHQRLMETAIALKEPGMHTVVFTFDANPLTLVDEKGKPVDPTRKAAVQNIQEREERIRSVYADGIDYLVLFPFNKTTMAMEPEQFVRDILVNRLDVKILVAGYDFRFGKDRAGDVHLLQKLGEKYGFAVKVLDKVKVRLEHYQEPVEVSSTLIKKEILEGHMENVRQMLGRPFSITGVVAHGKHLGSKLGFPTINLNAPSNKILPPNGVYASITYISDPEEDVREAGEACAECPGYLEDPENRVSAKACYSITNVGCRPTFDDGEQRTVETSIFDFDQDLYGRTVTVAFCHFIRPERKFESVEALVQTIEQNKRTVREYFAANPHTEFLMTDSCKEASI